MKWLLLTVLSFQLLIAPACVAAVNCGHALDQAEGHTATHLSSTSDAASHGQPCDNCDTVDDEAFSLIGDAASMSPCASTPEVAVVALQSSEIQIAANSAAYNFVFAPPTRSSGLLAPKTITPQHQNVILRTSRLRL